jgi:hypothetical protein
MAYQIVETNPQTVSGYYTSTFTLTDDAGLMPQVVLQKVFKTDPDIATIVSNQKLIDVLVWTNQYLANN